MIELTGGEFIAIHKDGVLVYITLAQLAKWLAEQNKEEKKCEPRKPSGKS